MIVDAFSGLTMATSLPVLNAETVVQAFLNTWVAHYSFPREIVSDNGTEFANQVFQHLCDRTNIIHVKTTPYHSRSNGLAERRIRALNVDRSPLVYKANPFSK